MNSEQREQIYGPALRLEGPANDFLTRKYEEAEVSAQECLFGGRPTAIQMVKAVVSEVYGPEAFERNLTRPELEQLFAQGRVHFTVEDLAKAHENLQAKKKRLLTG